MLRLSALAVAMLPSLALAAPACLPYGPVPVTLHGTVQRVKAYGPPGFGETPRQDSREDFDGLKLDQPLCTIADARGTQDAEANIPLLQMLFDQGHPALRPGQRIVVTGTLFHADTGHHHTSVLIEVASLQ